MSHLLPRDELSEFLSGYKRTFANEKAEGNMSQHEGKRPIGSIPKASYIFLSEWVRGIAIFNQYVIIILCWNLINLSLSVARLIYNHNTWIEMHTCVELQ